MATPSAQFEVKAAESTDLDLVHACQNGDVEAFEQLVKRYDRKLLRISQSVTRNKEDSQDVVQETFLKVFQHLGEFREDSQFSTWLFRITVNQSLMKLRKQRSTQELPLDERFETDGNALPIEVTDWSPNPEQLYGASELRHILIKTLEALPPILRTVFVLRDLEELSIDQTAEILKVTRSAVKARLWRARLELRERLNEYFSRKTESEQVDYVLTNMRQICGAPASHFHSLPCQRKTNHFWRAPYSLNLIAERPTSVSDPAYIGHLPLPDKHLTIN